MRWLLLVHREPKLAHLEISNTHPLPNSVTTQRFIAWLLQSDADVRHNDAVVRIGVGENHKLPLPVRTHHLLCTCAHVRACVRVCVTRARGYVCM